MSKSSLDRILNALREDIQTRQAGEKLPTVRDLMEQFQASPITINKALKALALEGKIITKTGSGTFVADPVQRRETKPTAWQEITLGTRYHPGDNLREFMANVPSGCIPLQSGYLDSELQAVEALQSSLKAVMRKPSVWGWAPTEGIEELRAWFAHEAGGYVRAADVQIVSGGQAALSTIFSALTEPGQNVLVESPTYLGALAVMRSNKLNPIPVPTDAQGVIPEFLDSAFQKSGAKVFYTQPRHSNPSGATLSPYRRKRVLEIAEKHQAFIVEDDYLNGLTFEGTPPPPLISENENHVIYLRSLTKSVAPSLRVGAVIAKGAARARINSMSVVDGLFVSRLLQEAALHLLTSPAWPKHLKKLHQELKYRRNIAIQELKNIPGLTPYTNPTGGVHMWLRLPEGIRAEEFTRAAERNGVIVVCGNVYFPAEPNGDFIRMSFGSVDPQTLKDGIHRLREVIEHWDGPSPRVLHSLSSP